MAKTRLPFGSWPSPISAASAAKASRRFGCLTADGAVVYWTQSRPEQGGRQVIMRALPDGRSEEVLEQPFSARSRVHEYGGGEFLVADGVIYFVNDSDQQIYRLEPGRPPTRLSDAPGTRFADFALDGARARLIAVAEMHPTDRAAREATVAAQRRPRNALVAVGLGGAARGRITELAAGRDFYASPRLSSDGRRLAYLSWDLPDMPWDSAAVSVAALADDGALLSPRRVAGGAGSAAFQPEWSAEGDLYYVDDASGFGALYRWREGRSVRVAGARGRDLMRPQWVLASRSYAIGADGTLACVFLERGRPRLLFLRAHGRGRARQGRLPARVARVDDPVAAGAGFAALVSPAHAAPGIAGLAGGGIAARGEPAAPDVAAGDLSRGEARRFRSQGRTVHGFYYPPANARHRGPRGAAPPAIVLVHGGPTAMTDLSLKMRIQYFTSRGFAIFDVNYSGSTGYGRAYRRRLEGAWGIADVADCVAAARYLAAAGFADRRRIAIAGGSAGGYTTLMALATSDVFAAGSSHYGIGDLKLLLQHTHKFEAGYLHRLLGTTRSRWQRLFAARSPLNLIGAIGAPVILFQGLEDRIVPPEQSRHMAEALRARGVEVVYHAFAGEGHGFRRAETIAAVLEAELAFLKRALRLAPA
jgi:dipeptidyl aminopeptidase/acylaminoacyl peptidase